MQRTLFVKIAITLGLLVLIGLPLSMVQSTIAERHGYRTQAAESIAADSVGRQGVIGPVLVIPFEEQYTEQVVTDTVAGKKASAEKRTRARRHLVFPSTLKVSGAVDTDRRYRGLHQVLVYSGQYAFSGDFELPSKAALEARYPNSTLAIGTPFVAVHVEDVRGIRNTPSLRMDGTETRFAQGANLTAFRSGVHAELPALDLSVARRASFSFGLNLDGMEQQAFVPIAGSTEVTVRSAWPHPQFSGRFLPSPKDRTISDKGFDATWKVSSLASDAQQQFSKAEQAGRDDAAVGQLDHFAVGFVEPVNIYSLSDRATKYGMMFVVLTFAAFFVFEILKDLRIHPVQYALVGLSLVMFFLLLASLSEHIDFLAAYVLASAGCIALITFYLRFVMGSWPRALGFGGALTALYGALYGLLISENNSLVLGSLLMFAVLAAIMVATRHVDWYQLGKSDTAA